MEIRKKLGKVLRSLREERGWSLSYVGEICETSGANVSKIELGQAKEYSLELLSKLAGAYGIQLYDLIASAETGAAAAKAINAEETRLLNTYRALSPTQRETLMSVALAMRPPKKS